MSSCDAPVVLIEGCSICKFISIGFRLSLPSKVILGFVKQPVVYDLFSFFQFVSFSCFKGSLWFCIVCFRFSYIA